MKSEMTLVLELADTAIKATEDAANQKANADFWKRKWEEQGCVRSDVFAWADTALTRDQLVELGRIYEVPE